MKTFATLAGLAGLVSAHMEMSNPPPFRSKFNDFTTNVDYSMTSPLSASGSDFPCKGYHSLMGTPQGQSVTSYEPGQSYQFTISGSTIHNGGSCQASLSYDGGSSWTVIHSYIGNCPISAGDTNYDFTIPNDTPAGEALFGWSWFNNVGNREMYMNCAVVTIGGGAGKRDVEEKRAPEDAFDSRPAMFVANVNNGCGTKEGSDVEFPNPGPDVTRKTPESDTAPPTGDCPAGNSGGNGGGNNGGGSDPAPEPQPEPEPEPQPEPQPEPEPTTNPGGVFVPVPTAEPTTFVTQTRTETKTESEPTSPPENDDGGNDDGNDGGNAGGEGTMEPGTKCDSEGQWNCVEGTQFQRCASGQWSALMDMYPGTKCVPGKSDNLITARSKTPSGNYARVVRASRKLQLKE